MQPRRVLPWLVLLALGVACERRIVRPPSIGAPAAASPATQWRVTDVCGDRVEESGGQQRPRVSADAIATHQLDDGQSTRALHFEILKSGEASFYDNQRQRAGEPSKPYCGWTSMGQSQLEKLEQTLVDHRFCSIKDAHVDPKGVVHKIRVRLSRVNCEVSLSTRGMDESPDAAAAYRAITALEPRCPNDYWPCEVPGAKP